MRWNETHKFRVFIKRHNAITGETAVEVTDENVTIFEARKRMGEIRTELFNKGLVKNGYSSSKGYRKAYYLDMDNFLVVFVSYSLMKDRVSNHIPSVEYHADDLFKC